MLAVIPVYSLWWTWNFAHKTTRSIMSLLLLLVCSRSVWRANKTSFQNKSKPLEDFLQQKLHRFDQKLWTKVQKPKRATDSGRLFQKLQLTSASASIQLWARFHINSINEFKETSWTLLVIRCSSGRCRFHPPNGSKHKLHLVTCSCFSGIKIQ